MAYDRNAALQYAQRWALSRNPRYYDFQNIGGDCTNFISQCLYAGCNVMNYTPIYGWYYISLQRRTASWTGVEFLYKFLTTNHGPGPYGVEYPISEAMVGDVIQLSFNGTTFSHSLFVTKTGIFPAPNNILIATHTFDVLNRPLNSYNYEKARVIHIIGARQ